MPEAVPQARQQAPSRLRLDRRLVIAVLDCRRELDRGHRPAHLLAGVGGYGRVPEQVERVDLVQVHVRVDERWDDERSIGFDDRAGSQGIVGDHGDPAVSRPYPARAIGPP